MRFDGLIWFCRNCVEELLSACGLGLIAWVGILGVWLLFQSILVTSDLGGLVAGGITVGVSLRVGVLFVQFLCDSGVSDQSPEFKVVKEQEE